MGIARKIFVGVEFRGVDIEFGYIFLQFRFLHSKNSFGGFELVNPPTYAHDHNA